MPIKLKAKFRGVVEVRAKVETAARALTDGANQIAMAGAQPILEEAQRLVPVKSGYLWDHIHIEQTGTPGIVRVTPVYPAANQWGWDPPYAWRIEAGFDGPDSLGRIYHQPAQPYMAPARENAAEESRQAMADAARRILEGAI